jgi:ribose 5-phosphate isomerase B
MQIYIGADHAGFSLKEILKKYLVELGCEVEDLGAYTLDPDDDYPDFVFPVAQAVSKNPGTFGIVIGRSGNGEAIAANKVAGIRAALCLNEKLAIMARQHNNANVLSLGADFIDVKTAKNIVNVFLATPFLHQERHLKRIKKISMYEERG